MSEGEAGLQAERTVLAHWRTGLAAVVVALLILRQASAGAERAVVAAATGAALALLAVAVSRRQRRLVEGRTAASVPTVVGIAVAVAVLQLAALVVVL